MGTVPGHLYYDVVAQEILDVCGVCNMHNAYQLADKYKEIIHRDNMADVPANECARNVRDEWLKPKKVEWISPLNPKICVGYNKF